MKMKRNKLAEISIRMWIDRNKPQCQCANTYMFVYSGVLMIAVLHKFLFGPIRDYLTGLAPNICDGLTPVTAALIIQLGEAMGICVPDKFKDQRQGQDIMMLWVGVLESTWQRSQTHLAAEVDGHTNTGSYSGIHALGIPAAGEDGQSFVLLRSTRQESLINFGIHID